MREAPRAPGAAVVVVVLYVVRHALSAAAAIVVAAVSAVVIIFLLTTRHVSQLVLSLHDSHIADLQTRRACMHVLRRATELPSAADALLAMHGFVEWLGMQTRRAYTPATADGIVDLILATCHSAATCHTRAARLSPRGIGILTRGVEALWWATDGATKRPDGATWTAARHVDALAHLADLADDLSRSPSISDDAEVPPNHEVRALSARAALALLDALPRGDNKSGHNDSGHNSSAWVVVRAASLYALPDGSRHCAESVVELVRRICHVSRSVHVARTTGDNGSGESDAKGHVDAVRYVDALERFVRWLEICVSSCAVTRAAIIADDAAPRAIKSLYHAPRSLWCCATLPHMAMHADTSGVMRGLNRVMALLIAARGCEATDEETPRGRSSEDRIAIRSS